jgi:acyl-CoA synthetase (AMP-forming)/AMP-acid ligase II
MNLQKYMNGFDLTCRLFVIKKIQEQYIFSAPDMIIEILSQTMAQKDKIDKFNLYEKNGVKEYWLVDPTYELIEVYFIQDRNYGKRGIYTKEQKVKVGIFEDLYIDLIVDIPINPEQSFMPLFVVLKDGAKLTEDLKQQINQIIRTNCSPRHVPNEIIQINELPKTLNGKKIEVPIKKILMGNAVEESVNIGSIMNPESIEFFVTYRENLDKMK